jgi:hypothetical protein
LDCVDRDQRQNCRRGSSRRAPRIGKTSICQQAPEHASTSLLNLSVTQIPITFLANDARAAGVRYGRTDGKQPQTRRKRVDRRIVARSRCKPVDVWDNQNQQICVASTPSRRLRATNVVTRYVPAFCGKRAITASVARFDINAPLRSRADRHCAQTPILPPSPLQTIAHP